MPFWRKRYSPISLIRSDGSYGDLTYVSSWYSYPDRLVESDFQRFHVVLRALYIGITTSAYRSRITSNGRGSSIAIYNATSCRTLPSTPLKLFTEFLPYIRSATGLTSSAL